MSEDQVKQIFGKNLSRLLIACGFKQIDLANHLGVSAATASDWCNGKKLPRMDKVQVIANWLGVQKSDLLEKKDKKHYYLNPETQRIGQEIFENKDLRLLFDAARDASPEDLKTVHDVLKALKAKEQGDYD